MRIDGARAFESALLYAVLGVLEPGILTVLLFHTLSNYVPKKVFFFTTLKVTGHSNFLFVGFSPSVQDFFVSYYVPLNARVSGY